MTTPLDVEALKAAAEAAHELGQIVAEQGEPAWYGPNAFGGRLPPEDTTFIALWNPETALRLLALLAEKDGAK